MIGASPTGAASLRIARIAVGRRHLRHAPVEHDQVEADRAGEIDGAAAVLGVHHLVAELLEDGAQHGRVEAVVLGHQHAQRALDCVTRRQPRRCARATSISAPASYGSSSVKQLPTPTAESAISVAPISADQALGERQAEARAGHAGGGALHAA